jgi:hypothetical protein
MFLRPNYRAKDGKDHTYWSLVETVRTVDGPRQRTLCYLGELNGSAQARWLKSVEVFNEQGQLAVTNGASLNGTLNLTLINSFVPAIGNTFHHFDVQCAHRQFCHRQRLEYQQRRALRNQLQINQRYPDCRFWTIVRLVDAHYP